jgi:imidazolonepropionase-like amidohydrolase
VIPFRIAIPLLLLCAPCAAPAQAPATSPPLAITNVAVVDATAAPRPGRVTVVVRDGRIAAVGRDVPVPAGARVVDGAGKWLMPGLWDMHVHLAGVAANPAWSRDVVLPLYLAHGVTGVRDMGSAPDAVLAWRGEVAAGRLAGPRIVTGGPMLLERGQEAPEVAVLASDSAADAMVASLRARGVDFVKVLDALSRERFLAVAAAARRAGLPLAGHLPDAVPAAEAASLGMRSIEHLSGMPLATSAAEPALRARRLDARARQDAAAYAATTTEMLTTHDAARAAALYAALRRAGTWQVPTLVWTRTIAGLDGARQDDPRLRHVPASVRAAWSAEKLADDFSPAYRAHQGRLLARHLPLVAEMSRAGVGILAGSDSTDPFVFPGSSLHEELALLVEAGLSPAEALRAATSSPAEFLGRADAGRVAPGFVADLVLVDGDPLADIANTRRISAVVAAGRLYDAAAIRALLAAVEAYAASH